MTERIFLKKGTAVKVAGIKKQPTDVVFDINAGINAILAAENVKTVAELGNKLVGNRADCCIQLCECCLQLSRTARESELQYL